MTPAQEFRTTATPDHGLVQIYDSDAYLPDGFAAERARETVAASSGPQLYLHSRQRTSPVELVLRVWDGPAPATEADWAPEGQTAAVLDSPTGMLVVRALDPEIAGVLDLPRTGVYAVRVSWRGRGLAAAQQAALLRALADGPGDGQAVLAAHQEVLETYRLDLWWQFESYQDEEDED
ncbi:hypothetical protein ACFC1R_36410 [Kitasatospora sp. NPDC056138]|uniref:hypothetical protein n=1 Tax=Kitasatospora sp. NPDC056138 TaxID=3345724 RepID=UPI0035D558B4